MLHIKELLKKDVDKRVNQYLMMIKMGKPSLQRQ